MRTRAPPPSPRSHAQDRGVRVNVLWGDAILRKRLELFGQRSPCIFLFSELPLPPEEVDAYVVGVHDIHLLAVPQRPASGAGPARLGSVGAGASRVPVIVAGPAEELRDAFLWGCADYLRVPFAPAELEVRVMRSVRPRELRFLSPWGEYGLEGMLLRLPDADAVRLTAHQARLARILMENRGHVLTRRALCIALWGHPSSEGSRALDVQVSALRRKMGHDVIRAVRGEGYCIDA